MQDEQPLPLTSSLESDVRDGFAVADRHDAMTTRALVSALEQLGTSEQSLEAMLHDAGFMPPSHQDAALLNWIDSVFRQWRERYPLDHRLDQLLDLARPLAAAFAVSDAHFFIPGGHPVHRLLDGIRNGLVGWQERVSSNNDTVAEGLRLALRQARRDFPNENVLENTLSDFSQKIDSHYQQLGRLDVTLIQRELTSLNEEVAQIFAASAINRILTEHQVPASVARFLKSDWYESGVLVVQREGAEGQAWRSFLATTQLVVDAVQPVSQDDANGLQRLHHAMQQLPATLSRQLLSLQPNDDAVTGAVGLIEYALLRNVRGQDMGLIQADPITVNGIVMDPPLKRDQLEDCQIQSGEWYSLESAEGEQRLRLIRPLLDNLFLLFMDFNGARARRIPTAEFKSMLDSGEAKPLTIADSFCRAMVEVTEAQQREVSQRREAEAAAAEELRSTQEAQEAQENTDTAVSVDDAHAEQQDEASPSSNGESGQSGQQGTETKEWGQHKTHNPWQPASYVNANAPDIGSVTHSISPEPKPELKPEPEQWNRRSPPSPEPPESRAQQTTESSAPDAAPEESQQAPSQQEVYAPKQDPHAMPTAEAPYESHTVVQMQIPMGTWLGFHDRNPPLMARVAVRDLEKDSYIFTNREGIKLRELTVAQLLALIDREMVDILERKTNFRETVNELRKEQQERLN
ncbi:conserved hypothetical protein [Luminiphilus syltensis NOR5-1B]|uniref:Thymidine phosphorylase n=1 Tax=Luminiphilus syltensis NOR5-1B TaxID=565045 RepID=B8KST4_9GAMM|nr:DUF1631 family protein [Luminiphilus syltensis]EED36963.1 conserved hypothetical protein [Luminiphilus syltensis NOR5-1B]